MFRTLRILNLIFHEDHCTVQLLRQMDLFTCQNSFYCGFKFCQYLLLVIAKLKHFLIFIRPLCSCVADHSRAVYKYFMIV